MSILEPSVDLKKANNASIILIVVSALGYFVDVYDMMLFTVVRKKSLLELGIPDIDTLSTGLRLLNLQTIGLLVGGIFWGILGDKKGRLTVLFGSIIIYSVANILNGFVTNILQYEILRVVAGFGLAGELGAGVTIIMETMKKEKRTIGTTLVASFGLVGAIVAGYVGQHFDWRTAYIVGGVMGLFLLFLRVGVFESGMYKNIKDQNIERGNFLGLFTSWDKFSRYAKTILIGLPSYFVLGLLLTIAPEFAKEIVQFDCAARTVRVVPQKLNENPMGTEVTGQSSQLIEDTVTVPAPPTILVKVPVLRVNV